MGKVITPQTERILGQEAKLFRDGPHPIYLLPDGRFAIRYGELWKTGKTLAAVEKVYQEHRPQLKIFRASDSQASQEVIDAVEMKCGKIIDRNGKRIWNRYYSGFYLYDEAAVRDLENIVKRIEEAQAEVRKLQSAFQKVLNTRCEEVTEKTFAAKLFGRRDGPSHTAEDYDAENSDA